MYSRRMAHSSVSTTHSRPKPITAGMSAGSFSAGPSPAVPMGGCGEMAAAMKKNAVQMAAAANTGQLARYTSFHVAVKAMRMPRQRVAPRRKRMAPAHRTGAAAAKANSSRLAASCWPVCIASLYATYKPANARKPKTMRRCDATNSSGLPATCVWL